MLIMSITLTSRMLLAQSTVKGTLVDSLNQDKLFYVSVGIVTTDSTMQEMGVAYTEADGSFSISGVPSGSYLLRASYLGYETLIVDTSEFRKISPVSSPRFIPLSRNSSLSCSIRSRSLL